MSRLHGNTPVVSHDRGGGNIGSCRCEVVWEHIGDDETLALAYLAHLHGERMGEHWTGAGDGMELAPLAAGVDRGRQVGQEGRVEGPTCEGRGQATRVDARHQGTETALYHVPREVGGRQAPQWEERGDARGRQELLPVAADVLQEQIAEGHSGDPGRPRLVQRARHGRLVLSVAAGARERDGPQGQPGSPRLGVEQFATDRVHRDAPVALVESGEEADDIDVLSAQDMERPGAILPAAPGQQRLWTIACPRIKYHDS